MVKRIRAKYDHPDTGTYIIVFFDMVVLVLLNTILK